MSNRNEPEFAQFRTSPRLLEAGFRHAFFTRRGGVSPGAYSSLNFSINVGDAPENVGRNLERAATALGVEARRVLFLSQLHGHEAIVLRGDEEREGVVTREGDALVGDDPACAIGVRIADCLPILVADRKSGAVAAIHAGWKGLVAGVIQTGVERLRGLGSGNGELVAAIGPHITAEAFEVSPDVAATLATCSPDRDVVDDGFGARPHVSLARVARAQLVALGVPEAFIDVVPGCTFRDTEDWFSYRRDGAATGRHLAAIVPRR